MQNKCRGYIDEINGGPLDDWAAVSNRHGMEPIGVTMPFMATGTNCPACDLDIGVWCVYFTKGNKLYCQHCGTRLEYANTPITVLVLAFRSSICLFTLGVVLLLGRLMLFGTMLILIAAIVLLVEFFILLHLRKHKHLMTVKDDGTGTG
jgi:hypothetical protein